jgi:hypothetical protein
MPRRSPTRNVPLDHFLLSELALGAGVPLGGLEIVARDPLILSPINDVSGRGAPRFYGVTELGRAAMIGAFAAAGAGTVLASRLAAVLADQFELELAELGFANQIDDNLDPLVKWIVENEPQFPWDRPLESTGGTFWTHHALRTRSGIYLPGRALDGDTLVEVVDRRYVFEHERGSKTVLCNSGARLPVRPCYMIDGWARDSDVKVEDIGDGLTRYIGDRVILEKYREREAEFLDARENAVGTVIINVSLAIRNALDRVHDHRIRAGDRRLVTESVAAQ